MYHLSDEYYLREYYLKSKELPTQSVIKSRMWSPLANVYFKSLDMKIKVMIGLEPPMVGGGADWYVPPKELLEGRSVLKPMKNECLSKLNYLGIDEIGMKLQQVRLKRLQIEKNKLITESDEKWKSKIEVECEQFLEDSSKEAAIKNTEKIRSAFSEFSNLYSRSIDSIEKILFDSARTEVIKIRREAFKNMQDKYRTLLKQQAGTVYDEYKDKLIKEKAKLKEKFCHDLAVNRSEMGEKIHDVYLDKHTAIEKLRQYLECQNLACQVYIALKEREECEKQLALARYEHQKKVKTLTENINSKDYEVHLQIQKEKKRQEIHETWQKKVNHVLKKFQLFVSYCLSSLPEYADFFINMEKLMLLQLNESLENPSAESIIVTDDKVYEGPLPQPRPFYLFCDQIKKQKYPVNQDLCPKRCTSSASDMPAIIVNKRCIYAACDNFEQFTNNIKSYIYGKRGDDADFVDENVYEHYVPVKYTSSQQLLELKLENSLLQVLQQEIPNLRGVSIECGDCKVSSCFCTSSPGISKTSVAIRGKTTPKQTSSHTLPTYHKIETRSAELKHVRGPTWDSYLKHIEPRKCACTKTTKKHLVEHLPVYMRNVSVYETAELPNYEICSLSNLKDLVREARGRFSEPPPLVRSREYKDASTQFADEDYEFLCTCYSDDEVERLFKGLITGSKMYDQPKSKSQYLLVDESFSRADLSTTECLATTQANSLKNLLQYIPELKDIIYIKTTDRTKEE